MMRTLVVALATLAPSAALACTCMWGLYDTLPETGDQGVATSASVYLDFTHTEGEVPWEFLLVDVQTGQSVEVTATDHIVGTSIMHQLTPNEPLAPHTDYAVIQVMGPENHIEQALFTTGEGPDTQPPSGGELLDTSTTSSGSGLIKTSCDPSAHITLELDEVHDDDRALVQVEATNLDDGEVLILYAFSERVSIGYSPCGITYPEVEGEHFSFRSRALDLSGNAGPWSSEQTDVVRGCSQSTAWGGLWLLPLVLGLRRRREPDSYSR